jgi:hypothetical protein
MSRKTMGTGLIVLGDVLLIVSLAADALGIGSQLGIGWKQMVGAAAGIVVQVAGLVMLQAERK